jgi:putative glycosyltransferase (TIGR04372 family)
MDHLLVRLARRRVLLADVHGSPDGQGIGYGMMLIRMRRALLFARMADVRVFFVPSRASLNAAVTSLESDDVAIVPAGSWRGRALTLLWHLAAPFRIGSPWLWLRRTCARAIVGPFYTAVEQSTRLPRRLRRFIMRQGPLYRRLKSTMAAYAARSEARWQQAYQAHALSRLHALEDAGEEVPSARLRLPAARVREVEAAAARLGLPLSGPLVTVHVRESGYRSTAGLRQRGWDDVRNAHIESFTPAFAALVDRGYTVVRLGDPSMTPVSMPGVVDLATSPERSPWLDIWCTMRSDFLIGCDSGPSWLAVLVGVPVLTVNAVHFRDLSRPRDRVICKLARDRTTGRTLSLSEMLSEDFLRSGFKGDRYEPLDNTPDDLRRAATDMMAVVRGEEQLSSWQSRFNRRLHEAARHGWGGRSALEGVALISRPRGAIAQGFAKKYFQGTGA